MYMYLKFSLSLHGYRRMYPSFGSSPLTIVAAVPLLSYIIIHRAHCELAVNAACAAVAAGGRLKCLTRASYCWFIFGRVWVLSARCTVTVDLCAYIIMTY